MYSRARITSRRLTENEAAYPGLVLQSRNAFPVLQSLRITVFISYGAVLGWAKLYVRSRLAQLKRKIENVQLSSNSLLYTSRTVRRPCLGGILQGKL